LFCSSRTAYRDAVESGFDPNGIRVVHSYAHYVESLQRGSARDIANMRSLYLSPSNIYAHKWEQCDVVISDNTHVLHKATECQGVRQLNRTLAGDLDTKGLLLGPVEASVVDAGISR
jgi:hypothetical protein